MIEWFNLFIKIHFLSNKFNSQKILLQTTRVGGTTDFV